MPRAKNAGQRRKLLRELREIYNMIKMLMDHWDVTSQIYVPPEERDNQNDWSRDRRPEEYPEEQAQSWAYVYNIADELIRRLTELRELALRRYKETVPEMKR
jgi:hypothetical protein